MKLACLEGEDISDVVETLKKLSEKYSVNFVLSVSMDAVDIPKSAQEDVVISL